MDRMDCQLVMMLFSWVHYKSFVQTSAFGLEQILAVVTFMDPVERNTLFEHLLALKENDEA